LSERYQAYLKERFVKSMGFKILEIFGNIISLVRCADSWRSSCRRDAWDFV